MATCRWIFQSRTSPEGNGPIELTAREFDLLALFLRHPNQVLTRATLMQRVWGEDFYGESNVLEVVVGNLRRALETGRPTTADPDRAWHRLCAAARVMAGLVQPTRFPITLRRLQAFWTWRPPAKNATRQSSSSMHPFYKSIRFRLTAWYAIAMILVIIALAMSLHTLLVRALDQRRPGPAWQCGDGR